ncbi:unnamed protein product [Paramecium octaurelia]|uniref:Uncharacterized protein n=1 Tax=Paramecium octaurelia TaxID=43137 RepID=A0A8S1UP00_PAROT|nr:unnamed protein product [Paramecium octaurelia]
MKLNRVYLKSTKNLDGLGRERARKMKEIKTKIIQEFKFLKAENDEQIESHSKDCVEIFDTTTYDESEMVVFITPQQQQRVIEIIMPMFDKIDRYFKILTEPKQKMKAMLKIMNDIINHHGLAGLSFDAIMICHSVPYKWTIQKYLNTPVKQVQTLQSKEASTMKFYSRSNIIIIFICLFPELFKKLPSQPVCNILRRIIFPLGPEIQLDKYKKKIIKRSISKNIADN